MVSEGTHDTECTFYSKIITNMLLSRFSEKPKYTDILNDDSITPTDLQSAYNIIIDIFRTEYTILASELPKLVSSQVEVEVNQTTEAEVEVIPDKPSNEDNNFINKPIKISDTLTQSDIESVVCIGSGFRDGKFRIYDYFNEKHTSKEKSDFLKKEYGSGGCTYTTPSNKHLWVQSSDKGINITYNNDAENSINIKYSELSKLISELIKDNRYLNKQEQSDYLYYVVDKKGFDFHDDESPVFDYKIGTTVYIGSAEYIVTNLTDDEVTVSQATHEINTGNGFIDGIINAVFGIINFFSAIVTTLPMIILIIVLCVCVCSVMVKLVARGFEITCLVTLSPLFFATLVGDTTSQYFKKFINAFLSTAGYIVFMAIVYVVATIWIDECTHMRVSGITDLAMSFISILPRCLIVIACCNIMRKPPKVLTSLVDGG